MTRFFLPPYETRARRFRTVRVLALLAAIGFPAAAPAGSDVPVVVPGRSLEPLLGRRIGDLRLLVWRDGAWHPIPFQIDPRVTLERPGRTTRLVHLLRAPGEPDPVPARAFAPEDELIFMSADTGAEPAAGEWPTGIRAGALLRITGGGVAGLFALDDPPPPSSRRYVRYDEAQDRVDARTYRLGFSRAAPLVFDSLHIRHAREEPGVSRPEASGAESSNLVDRVKVRVRGKILLAIPITRTEADFETSRDGTRVGPVRVVRGARVRLGMFLGWKSPEVEEEQIFYPDGFEFPIWFVKSGAMNRLATRLNVQAGPDWSAAALGMRMRVEGGARPADVNGRMEAGEERLSAEGATWNLLYGPEGAILSKLDAVSGPGGRPRSHVRIYYRDDRRQNDPPEREPGQVGAIGFEFPDLAELPPGEYHWAVRTQVMPRYREGDERAALEAPPRVTVVPVEIPREPAR